MRQDCHFQCSLMLSLLPWPPPNDFSAIYGIYIYIYTIYIYLHSNYDKTNVSFRRLSYQLCMENSARLLFNIIAHGCLIHPSICWGFEWWYRVGVEWRKVLTLSLVCVSVRVCLKGLLPIWRSQTLSTKSSVSGSKLEMPISLYTALYLISSLPPSHHLAHV